MEQARLRTPIKRRSREGDWICLQCNNYNYAFRNHCNRCRVQERAQNEQRFSQIGISTYAERSFPSVVFLHSSIHADKENHHRKIASHKDVHSKISPCRIDDSNQEDRLEAGHLKWIDQLLG